MRRRLLFFLLAGFSLLAMPSTAGADTFPSERAIAVSSPLKEAVLSASAPLRRTLMIHNVQIGEQTLALAVRHGNPDLIDVVSIGGSNDYVFRRRQGLLVVDRVASGARAELSLQTGQLWVDGLPVSRIDLSHLQKDSRLWLSAQALSSLLDAQVSISGRTNARLQVEKAQSPSATSDLLFPNGALVETGSQEGLFLAEFSEERGSHYPVHRITLPDLASFEGALGGKVRELSAPESLGDWRNRKSWQIETKDQKPPNVEGVEAESLLVSEEVDANDKGGSAVSVPRLKFAKMTGGNANNPDRNEPRLVSISSSPHLQDTSRSISRPAARIPVPSLKRFSPRRLQLKDLDRNSARLEPSSGANSPPGLHRPSRGPSATAAPSQVAAIKGTVFLDFDGNGRVGAADQRLEGEQLTLIDISTGRTYTKRSAAFGQFGFTGLQPGRYRLRVLAGWQEHAVDLDIQAGDTEDIVPLAIAAGSPDGPAREIKTAPA